MIVFYFEKLIGTTTQNLKNAPSAMKALCRKWSASQTIFVLSTWSSMETSFSMQRNFQNVTRACTASRYGRLNDGHFRFTQVEGCICPHGLFQGDPPALSVQLSTDGVNLFSANKICYSMWPIMLSVLNWPKVCLFENVMLVGVVPANGKGEAKSVAPYLKVVVDEIMTLSENLFYDG